MSIFEHMFGHMRSTGYVNCICGWRAECDGTREEALAVWKAHCDGPPRLADEIETPEES